RLCGACRRFAGSRRTRWIWAAYRGVHRMHYRGGLVRRLIGVVPVVCVALFRPSNYWRTAWAMVDGAYQRDLAAHRAHDRWHSDCPALHGHTRNRPLAEIWRGILGHWRYFFGHLPALSVCWFGCTTDSVAGTSRRPLKGRAPNGDRSLALIRIGST